MCVASNVNLYGITKSLALGSLIAQRSPTLCLFYDTFMDCCSCKSLAVLAQHIYNLTTRSHPSFSMHLPFLWQKHGFLLHFWPGLGVGLLAECCTPPLQKGNISISVSGCFAGRRTARYRVCFCSRLLRSLNSWNCTSKTGVRPDHGPWPLKSS